MKSIKAKMQLIIFLNILLVTIISSLYIITLKKNEQRLVLMNEKSRHIISIEEKIHNTDYYLQKYIKNKNSSDINYMMINIDELTTLIKEQDSILFPRRSDLLINNIQEISKNYIQQVDQVIYYKRLQNLEKYEELYADTLIVKSYIINYIDEVKTLLLEENSENNGVFIDKNRIVQYNSAVMIIMIICMSLYLGRITTANIIKPILALSKSASKITKGHFDIQDVKVYTDDELELLSNTFNKMKNSIRIYIDELHEQANNELLLREKEIENLKMKNSLDNAKLYALQSQINPHFLYNTINAGVQMAMIEGADNTSDFLEHMARMFRYNLKGLDKPTKVIDEINNIRNYYKLLKVRYRDLIEFEFMVDETINNYTIPPLTLQPLVENSIIHGFKSKNTGGKIRIITYDEMDFFYLIVWDNGVGIDTKITIKDNKSNSVGLNNVMERLEIFYDQKDIMTIESKLNEYTKITLKLPKKVII